MHHFPSNRMLQHSITTWKSFFTILVLLVTLSLAACHQQTWFVAPTEPVVLAGSLLPRAVYAQPDFTTHTLHPTGRNTLHNAGYITADQSGGFYVADYDNNRVLHFPSSTGTGPGPQADQVYGQANYTSNAPHTGAAGLSRPHGVTLDPNGGLYIADMLNNRVLHYPPRSTTADFVYGQGDFTTTDNNAGGLSASSLYHPQGIATDSTGIYVADSSNNRVLHYPPRSTTADFVYGQGAPGNSQVNFTSNMPGKGTTGLNNPRDVAVDSTGIYIADSGNHRVMHYSIGNPTANRVYGQPDFFPTSVHANQGLDNPTAATLNNPTMLALDRSSGLYIADRNNNRILYYPPSLQSAGAANDPSATRIYGQTSYTTSILSTTASTFNGPGGVAVDINGDVFVLDIFNQRVLKFVL